MFFRVYMSGKIGAEGMGLYQLIFSIYVLASTFATSGISTAVTRLVAEEAPEGGRAASSHTAPVADPQRRGRPAVRSGGFWGPNRSASIGSRISGRYPL